MNAYTPEDVLAHRGKMLFLDNILHYDKEQLCASICVRPNGLYYNEQGAAGWMGLEWMAQAAGAWIGAKQLDAGQRVNIGFLTGTRKYQGPERFAPGIWYVLVTLVLFDNDTGILVMDATLSDSEKDESPCANSRVKLFQPANVPAFIESQRTSVT